MAGDEAEEGSRSRRRVDLNLYLGLPPLPRPPGRLDAALDCPALIPNSAGPAPDAPRTDEPEELLTPAVLYSPSNALSTPEEQSMLDPIVYAWLDGHSTDGEDGTDAVEPAVVLGAPVDGANVSPPVAAAATATAAGLEGDDLPLWVERFVHPGRVSGGVEMVSTMNIVSRSIQGAVEIEARTPELRFQRLIQISQQHGIVRSGSANRSQRANSPEADRLVWAIQRSHNSLDSAWRQKLDGDDKVGGKSDVKKDGCCGCNSSFECNICLDAAKEPVVTPCGHLFCWPCLYQWLHGHSAHSECPVCKGEVLEVNVTPIYGRGGDERDSSILDMPPRPRANRMESLRQQLQMADTRGIATVVRQLIENQGIVRGQTNPAVGVEVPVVPASRSRARARRQQRQDSISAIMLMGRQQLQMGDTIGNATVARQLIENQGIVRGQTNPVVGVEVPVVPASRSRARARRQQRQDSISAIMLNMGNVAPESSNQIPLPPSNADSTVPAVPATPQQSSSVEQPSTSSTAGVIVGEPGSSRRSRPSESPTTRRTRRRQQGVP
ncbi:uncharacterized protein LOC133895475 [Phragmites australis]|uniref:uncharacterized protein LOC133895475 n=1 Tax=Phragmites australis TaxID=29695 RepID=UPI002D76F4AA|nr:uncharacterized protein LOC133895475 [Phragmites australis]